MAKEKVITGAIAIIKVQGVTIGKMKGIRVTESLQRGRVSGIGQLTPDELPALSWSGTLTCDFYNIDFKKSQLPGAIQRAVQTLDEWADSVLLQEDGVQVDIYRKVTDLIDPTTKVIKSKPQVYATIKGLFLDGENFDISEGQISGRNQSFQYIFPIFYPA